MASLGPQHDTKPVTASDKVMSKRHLRHRAEVGKMKGPAKLRASRFYNLSHSKEHLLALGSVGKPLARQVGQVQKKLGLMSLKGSQ